MTGWTEAEVAALRRDCMLTEAIASAELAGACPHCHMEFSLAGACDCEGERE